MASRMCLGAQRSAGSGAGWVNTSFRGLFRRVRAVLDGKLPYKVAIVDSTPVPKPNDPEAEVGFYTRGAFKGFKVHVASCEHGLPRSAMVTAGNCHDSPFIPKLLEDMGFIDAEDPTGLFHRIMLLYAHHDKIL